MLGGIAHTYMWALTYVGIFNGGFVALEPGYHSCCRHYFRVYLIVVASR